MSFEHSEQRAWNTKFGRTQCIQFPLDKERLREPAGWMVRQWCKMRGSVDTDGRILYYPFQRLAPKKEAMTPTEFESTVLKRG